MEGGKRDAHLVQPVPGPPQITDSLRRSSLQRSVKLSNGWFPDRQGMDVTHPSFGEISGSHQDDQLRFFHPGAG